MTLSKRTALGISLGVIVLYWIYQIVSQRPDAPLPAHFSDLVWRIVRTKMHRARGDFPAAPAGGRRVQKHSDLNGLANGRSISGSVCSSGW